MYVKCATVRDPASFLIMTLIMTLCSRHHILLRIIIITWDQAVEDEAEARAADDAETQEAGASLIFIHYSRF